MLTVEERFVIKDLAHSGVSISEIARRTGHDRKTVRRAVQDPLLPPAVPPRRTWQQHKLDPYQPYLEQRIAAGVLNAHKLFGELRARGYPGGESQVKAFVQRFRQPAAPLATVRFETPPGEQAQVDWGHFGLIQHHGQAHRLYAFVMTLGWSRTLYLEFTISADSTAFLRGHLHAFTYFGGVPRQVLHDNLKSAVLARRPDGTVQWHPRYLDCASACGFTPRACPPYRAQTKGKVERGIGYVRGNFWVGLTYGDLADLNAQARTWLDTVANVRVHGTTHAVPFQRLAAEELQPLDGVRRYDTSVVLTRQASREGLIRYGGNAYSVPSACVGQRLLVRLTEQEDLIVCTAQGDEVARHRLVAGTHQQIVVPTHLPRRSVSLLPAPTPPAAQQRSEPIAPDGTLQRYAPTVEVRPLQVYEQLLGMHAVGEG
jgi:transposase